MSALWDAQQREWLQAMGYSVLALAGEEPAAGQATGDEPTAAAAQERAGPARSGPGRGPGPEDAGNASARRTAPAGASGEAAALLRAVLRAARRDPGDAEVQALFDPDALRAPAAKRALWPRLRALRRARGGRG